MFQFLSRHLPAVLRINPRLALFALAATAASGLGQTFFVSFFGGEIRQAFDLTHTAYGSLYSGATLCSALLLLRFGGLLDTWTLPRVTALAIGILAGWCLLVGFAPGALVLAAGFVCIRFGGQGMMSHIGMTTAARPVHCLWPWPPWAFPWLRPCCRPGQRCCWTGPGGGYPGSWARRCCAC